MESKRNITEEAIREFFLEYNTYGGMFIYGCFDAETSVVSTALIEFLKSGDNHMQEYCDIINFKSTINKTNYNCYDLKMYLKWREIIYGKHNFWNINYFLDIEEIETAKKFLICVHNCIEAENAYIKRKKVAKRKNKSSLQTLLETTDCCAICGIKTDLTLDHKIPLKLGGKNKMDNYQVLCKSCNSKKGCKI